MRWEPKRIAGGLERLGLKVEAMSVRDDGLWVRHKAVEVIVFVAKDQSLEFYEPNQESYGPDDKVLLGRGWRRLEIASKKQYLLTQALKAQVKGPG